MSNSGLFDPTGSVLPTSESFDQKQCCVRSEVKSKNEKVIGVPHECLAKGDFRVKWMG